MGFFLIFDFLEAVLKKINSVLITAMILLFALELAATNGYFSHGYGTKNKSMGGAAAAMPLTTLSGAVNPAGLVFVADRIDTGLAVFIANRDYTYDGKNVESDTDFIGLPFFLLPSIGTNFMLMENMSLGVNLYGNGGMNTNYPEAVFSGGTSPTGVDLMQMFVDTNVSMKLHKDHSIGASLILGVQMFKVDGLEGFDSDAFTASPGNVTGNGYDKAFGAGARIGYYGRLHDMVALGLSYQSEIFMTKFKNYEGLFAEDGGFNIPSSITAGFAVTPVPEFTFAFDFQRIFYSQVKSVSNEMDFANKLGEDNGSGFGWDDMNIFKAGVQYEASDAWSARAGYSYGKQPIGDDDVYFNILAPAVVEQHITLGGSMKVFADKELSIALMHAFSNSQKGKFAIFDVEIEMNQWDIEVGLSF